MLEKTEKFLVAVARLALRNYPTRDDVKRGEQGHRAGAEGIMRHPFGIAQSHRQDRLGTLQRLDLALFIHAQYECLIRRIKVKPHDCADFFNEERVGGKLEAPGAVRLNCKQGEIAAHRTFLNAGLGRRTAYRPVGGDLSFALQHCASQCRDFVITMLAWPPRPQLAVQTGQTIALVAAPPQTDNRRADSAVSRYRAIRSAIRRLQYNLRAPHHR